MTTRWPALAYDVLESSKGLRSELFLSMRQEVLSSADLLVVDQDERALRAAAIIFRGGDKLGER
jgi:hypothetical protein